MVKTKIYRVYSSIEKQSTISVLKKQISDLREENSKDHEISKRTLKNSILEMKQLREENKKLKEKLKQGNSRFLNQKKKIENDYEARYF